MRIGAVVADANVLLSAAVGKSPLRVFTDFRIEVHASEYNTDEVTEYLPEMAAKYRLPTEVVQLQWKLLPLRVHPQKDYGGWFEEALAALAHRDPEDAHVLALARSLELPIWSNDRDLTSMHAECYTTAQLLRALKEQHRIINR